MDQISPQKLAQVEVDIFAFTAKAIDTGALDADHLHLVANYVKENLAAIRTHKELVDFFDKMAKEWPAFATLGNTEMSKAIEAHKGDTLSKVSLSMKEGKIDDALAMARAGSMHQ